MTTGQCAAREPRFVANFFNLHAVKGTLGDSLHRTSGLLVVSNNLELSIRANRSNILEASLATPLQHALTEIPTIGQGVELLGNLPRQLRFREKVSARLFILALLAIQQPL